MLFGLNELKDVVIRRWNWLVPLCALCGLVIGLATPAFIFVSYIEYDQVNVAQSVPHPWWKADVLFLVISVLVGIAIRLLALETMAVKRQQDRDSGLG